MEIDRVSKVVDDERNQEILKGLLKEYRLRTGVGPATAAQILKAAISIVNVEDRINIGVKKFGSGFEDLHHIEGGEDLVSSGTAKA